MQLNLAAASRILDQLPAIVHDLEVLGHVEGQVVVERVPLPLQDELVKGVIAGIDLVQGILEDIQDGLDRFAVLGGRQADIGSRMRRLVALITVPASDVDA
ncbi:MAG: hypothetical protein Q8M58_08385, partial [Anaerolineales bacterium]|nr:hypothetical protein [Anaerolineales bacterium]